VTVTTANPSQSVAQPSLARQQETIVQRTPQALPTRLPTAAAQEGSANQAAERAEQANEGRQMAMPTYAQQRQQAIPVGQQEQAPARQEFVRQPEPVTRPETLVREAAPAQPAQQETILAPQATQPAHEAPVEKTVEQAPVKQTSESGGQQANSTTATQTTETRTETAQHPAQSSQQSTTTSASTVAASGQHQTLSLVNGQLSANGQQMLNQNQFNGFSAGANH